ncbi:DUF4244 domain-containing protein [Nonomuraea sp. NPDC050556]|uniref:DUF4244 domain-containing protein n=1 Tax=Nonomuraea sp. NPDC050556 TaxID=3364369 RepID=UPI0037A083EF
MHNPIRALSATTQQAAALASRCRTTWTTHLSRCANSKAERGMSTAEYAVGTIAACAFAALLFKVVSSPEVQEMLSSLVNRALNTTG